MPSRPSPPSLPLLPTARPPSHHHYHLLVPILAASLAITLLLLFFLSLLSVFLYRRFSHSRTAPTTEPKSPNHLGPPLRRFSYSHLRRATAYFSPSTRLGHGAFGSVHKAILPGHPPLAVKAMDAAAATSLQGHQEFNTELSLAAITLNSPHILSLLGYSLNRSGSRRLLVYELMPNRSLQECLLENKPLPLSNWTNRFSIALDIARGLDYLHHGCNPPVIHGDIKPSNVLLDGDFRAKIGDFGLARLKIDQDSPIHNNCAEGDNRLILEETESVATGVEEGIEIGIEIEQSPESCCVRVAESPEVGGEGFDRMSVESGGERKVNSRRDWWWRQDNDGGGGSESRKVKDYVMQWIGSEIKKERPKADGSSTLRIDMEKEKKNKKKWKWWANLDDHETKKNKRKPREWWKEEFCDEIAKKTRKSRISREENWPRNNDVSIGGGDEHLRKKRKSSSKNQSNDCNWSDGMSGGVSSTPSMRGTICYIAPEYGGGSRLSEKCDVYSYGVLLLVLVSGRRPLQVTSSPMSQFERANLISWARQLASSNGRLLDLVDGSLLSSSLDEEQALLCITVALLCLQRSPSKRPTMKEVVGVLSGEVGPPPQLPFEFSPSPPSNFQFKSRKTVLSATFASNKTC